MKQIYLDYSATAPLRPETVRAMRPYLTEVYGNPASIHGIGQQALNAVDTARRDIADVLNCRPAEIIFTGSGTEADNLAIKGRVLSFKQGHIITSAIEHKAVLASCEYLVKLGYEVTYIKPNRGGIVEADKVIAAVRPNTMLVSIMYVNNEIGTIQPIREIGKRLAKTNQRRQQPVVFHTDAVQAGNFLNLDVKHLHVDMLTLSAHKLGGPKGVGLLFVNTGLNLVPQIHGGGQEQGVRSSTLNVAGIVGLAKTLTLAHNHKVKENKRLRGLQTWLFNQIKKLDGITINGNIKLRIPSNVNISVPRHSSDELVIYFDRHNLAVSAASACASGSIEPSYVLQAMGASNTRARSSLRLTMGYGTIKSDLIKFLKVLNNLL